MVVYTAPVFLGRHILVPSRSITVPERGTLASVNIGEAVESAKIVGEAVRPGHRTLSTRDGRQFEHQEGFLQPVTLDNRHELKAIEIWLRIE